MCFLLVITSINLVENVPHQAGWVQTPEFSLHYFHAFMIEMSTYIVADRWHRLLEQLKPHRSQAFTAAPPTALKKRTENRQQFHFAVRAAQHSLEQTID